MEKLKLLYEKFKDKNDCSYCEFIDLYDTMLDEINKHGITIGDKELRDMYNHEYVRVKKWPTTVSKSTSVYNENRKKGFIKMKRILESIITEK